MNQQSTLPLQPREMQSENRLSPVGNKSPLSHESSSFDNEDAYTESRQIIPDVHTQLLRKLSLEGFEEKNSKLEFRRQLWFKSIITLTCITSLVSVSLNTPKSFKRYPDLKKITLGLDILVACVLSIESAIKCAEKGFVHAPRSYLRSPGRVFEFTMVLFVWISIIFQAIELAGFVDPYTTKWYVVISGLRSPRPLVVFRVGKNILHVGIPKNISKRPLRQIRSVLVFTLYFMTLASLIGVQLFGPLAGYCVLNSTNPERVFHGDLMIPATRCSHFSNESYSTGNYKCPAPFVCKELKLGRYREMTTYFKNAALGLLTVYEAQSQEGWTAVMYDTMDSSNDLVAVGYFILLIFFIAWLAKNIFIAIVTEVFADLRSQVHNLYNNQSQRLNKESSKVLKNLESGMRLVEGREMLKVGSFRLLLQRIVKSFVFKSFFLLCVVLDALLQSLLKGKSRIYVQTAFTILFDIEALLKIITYSPVGYLSTVPHRFECLLALGSTACLPPTWLAKQEFALFKVFRPFRIALAWPSLASFMKRILGNGKKLVGLILFTLIFLVSAAGVSLQLFCSMNLNLINEPMLFHTFPDAMQALFQVLMQEAWNDVMDKMLDSSSERNSFLVYAFFILFHILASVILISVFVALILDNLELDEELKVIKQQQLGEEAEINYSFPFRLRLFERFKARPKVVRMGNIGCSIPKVRESFMGSYLSKSKEAENFADDDVVDIDPFDQAESNSLGFDLISIPKQKSVTNVNTALRKQSSVTALIRDSHQRKYSSQSSSFRRSSIRHRRRSITRRGHNQAKDKQATAAVQPHALLMSPRAPVLMTVSERLNQKSFNVDAVRQRLQEARRKKETLVEKYRENYPYFDKSLFFLPYDSKLRCTLRKIVHARYEAFSDTSERKRFFSAFSVDRFKNYLGSQAYLDWGMLLLTHFSCFVMMTETPQQGTFKNTLTTSAEIIFVATTTIEIGLKMLADGLFLTPTALVRDFVGVLHVFIYIVGLVYVLYRPDKIPPGSFAQILLVLRALRPLRLITLAPPLNKVVKILVRGYKDIIKVAILQLLLMFVFANYGLQMFSGKLFRCTDVNKTTESSCTGLCTVNLTNPRRLPNLHGRRTKMLVPCVWRNPYNFNFDTLSSALLSLFEVLSLEGWTNVRDILTEQFGWYAGLYLHIYVFFACLIGLSLFIGVVVSNFNENKGTALLTVDQRRWEDLKKRLKLIQPLHIPPRPEDDESRGRMYDFLQNDYYHWIGIATILLNGIPLLYAEWYPDSFLAYRDGSKSDSDTHIAFTALAVIFSYFYVVDFVIKVKAYRLSGYWLSWRNRFDFILTVFGLIWSFFQIASYIFHSFQSTTLRIGVCLIILRQFTLAGRVNSLRMLVLTVGMSLLKSFFTISVLVVLMMCYAMVGVVLFGSVKSGLALNRHANFRTSWRAMLLLFRMTTGEDWNKIMHDCMIAPPRCTKGPNDSFWETDCGNYPAAVLFFSSYYLLITYIFLNLFIAVVIENFSLFSSTDEDMLMSNSDLKCYQEEWNLIDTSRSGKLSAKKAKLVLRLSISKPEFSIQLDRFLYKRMCVEIDKVSCGKEVSFHDLLLILAYNDSRFKISRHLQLEERLAREDQVRGIVEEVAAETIRTWWVRIWRRKKENKEQNQNRPLAKQSVSSALSATSLESEVSKSDDLNTSMTSVRSTNQRKMNETAIEKLADTYSGHRDIYDWWADEMDQHEMAHKFLLPLQAGIDGTFLQEESSNKSKSLRLELECDGSAITEVKVTATEEPKMLKLHVFLVDTGIMYTFDMEMALESVSKLMEAIAMVTQIPVSKQVLLATNGDPLNPVSRVGSYKSAGTETNPIFLFSKSAIESPQPPLSSSTFGSAEASLDDQVDKCLQMPPTYDTLVVRAKLASEFHLCARELGELCENLVGDQQLQQQGWLAVVSNLDNITRALNAHGQVFKHQYTNFLQTQKHYLDMLERFDNVISLLSRIPVLSCLLKKNSIEEESEPMALLEWVTSKEQKTSLHTLVAQCKELLSQFDETVPQRLIEEIDRVLDSSDNLSMKEIKGLNERLVSLQQRLSIAQQFVQDQADMAQGFKQNQMRAEHLGDPSVLPDLCASHKKQLLVLLKNHRQLSVIVYVLSPPSVNNAA
eukprot:gene7702-8539_t